MPTKPTLDGRDARLIADALAFLTRKERSLILRALGAHVDGDAAVSTKALLEALEHSSSALDLIEDLRAGRTMDALDKALLVTHLKAVD